MPSRKPLLLIGITLLSLTLLAGTVVFSSSVLINGDLTVTGAIIGGPDGILVVDAGGNGEYATINAALQDITCDTTGCLPDSDASNRYTLVVAPGTYNEQVDMLPYVDIEGAGEGKTIITYSGGTTLATAYTVKGADNTELRNLAILSATSSNYAIGIYNDGTTPSLMAVTVTAKGGTSGNYALYNTASYGNYTLSVDTSVLTGSTSSVRGDGEYTVRFVGTQLDGAATANGGTLVCIASYDYQNTVLGSACEGAENVCAGAENGASCNSDAVCVSGETCANNACSGGIAVPLGTDPYNDCPDQGPCGFNGVCDGGGACEYYGYGTVAVPGSACEPADECDGAGGIIDGGYFCPIPTITDISPPTLAIGDLPTTVTITGANFVTDADVYFNTTPAASVSYVSPTELTVTVPGSLTIGTYDVTVDNDVLGGLGGAAENTLSSGLEITTGP